MSAPTKITLWKKRQLEMQIGGQSGFARVFQAACEDETQGLIKLVPKEAGADRELLFQSPGKKLRSVPLILN